MSRDYAEDQKNELEALESIYFEELESEYSINAICYKSFNLAIFTFKF